MATAEPQLSSAVDTDIDAAPDSAPSSGVRNASDSTVEGRIVGPSGWKRRLEDPFNTYYRYPVALALTRVLVKTPVTPNQVSLVQPLFAAGAGYLVTFNDWRYHLGAVALFETRSILDCVDGSLARAKRLSSPNGHAIDAMADWLGVVMLYLGIFWHFYTHPVPGYSTAAALAIVGVALFQGAVRSFSSDYFKNKFIGIFERARDESAEVLRAKAAALTPESSIFAHIDVFILRMGRLSFDGERPSAGGPYALPPAAIEQMVREQHGPRAKLASFFWSISNGDAFLSFVILSILVGQLWAGQLFFATAGLVWIFFVVVHSVSFVRSYRDAAPAEAASRRAA